MTPLALWAAVALVALVATSLWAVLARDTAVYVTSGISFTAWAWLGIVGGDVALVNGGDPIWVRQTIASLQFVCIALALVSLIVFAIRLMGAYPNAQQSSDSDTTTSS